MPFPVDLFRIADYRRFLAARFLASIAVQLVGVAVGWQVYALTNDPFSLGMVGLVQFLPAFLLTLPGGHAADRYDRRSVLAFSIGLQLVGTLLLTGLALQPAPAIWAVYAVLAVMGAARAFFGPASQSLVALLVPAKDLPRAVAIGSTTWQIAVIAGPVLGGLLYILGPAAAFGSGALLLVAAQLMVLRISHGLRSPSAMAGGLDGLFEGVRFVRRQREILGAISLDLFAVLLGGATALLPIYARDILHTGPAGLGLLRSAPAAGATLAAIWLAHRPPQRRVGVTLFAGVATFGAATIVFGLSSDLMLSLAALAIMGAADMISVVIRQTLVQLRTPDTMRGRVSAVNFVFIGASNELGEFESGLTAAWFGAVPAVVIGGIGTMVVAALWAWAFPPLRRLDRFTSSSV
jgi:MFS family permease